jgi:RNA polymerase sigma-70 factor (ECF subfamily)
MTRDTHIAEDIFQNVAIKAMTVNSKFENKAVLVSWCLVTLRHECLDWLKKSKRELPLLDNQTLELIDAQWELSSSVTTGSKLDILRDCMSSAGAEVQTIMRMRYFENLSCTEVASRLGTNLTTVYKRLSRAHMGLKACVERKLPIGASE